MEISSILSIDALHFRKVYIIKFDLMRTVWPCLSNGISYHVCVAVYVICNCFLLFAVIQPVAHTSETNFI